MTDTTVTVNGQSRPLDGVATHVTALDWLRDTGLSGSKEGCAEGECGACAMMVATAEDDGTTRWTPVNACLVPVYALDGQEIVTAEGLGGVENLHPVQEKLAEAGGSQCGYCTPGFACSMAAEYYRPERPSSRSARSGTRPSGGHQPLVAPASRPRTKKRWRAKNTINGMMIEMKVPADCRNHLLPHVPDNELRA